MTRASGVNVGEVYLVFPHPMRGYGNLYRKYGARAKVVIKQQVKGGEYLCSCRDGEIIKISKSRLRPYEKDSQTHTDISGDPSPKREKTQADYVKEAEVTMAENGFKVGVSLPTAEQTTRMMKVLSEELKKN